MFDVKSKKLGAPTNLKNNLQHLKRNLTCLKIEIKGTLDFGGIITLFENKIKVSMLDKNVLKKIYLFPGVS